VKCVWSEWVACINCPLCFRALLQNILNLAVPCYDLNIPLENGVLIAQKQVNILFKMQTVFLE